jgi:hypothetical protein
MWRVFCSDVSYTGVFNGLQSHVVWWRLHQKLAGELQFSIYRFHDSDVRRRCLLKSNAIWFLIKGSLLKYEAFITWDLISVTLFGTLYVFFWVFLRRQTPGKYPKEHIQYSKHGESLKSRIIWNSFRFNEYSKKDNEIVAYYSGIQDFYFPQQRICVWTK